MVIRDHMNEFYAGLSKAGKKPALAEVANMVATFEEINFALEVGFQYVILEIDNIFMITIRSNEESLASCGAIMANVVRMSRSCNKVGFLLFREGVNLWLTL